MNESDLIKVLQELKVYSQTYKSVSTRNFACQTEIVDDVNDNNNNIPIFYSCRLSLDGDVETQCNIPPTNTYTCKSCAKSVCFNSVSTQCRISPLSEETKYSSKNVSVKSKKIDDRTEVPISKFKKLQKLKHNVENKKTFDICPAVVNKDRISNDGDRKYECEGNDDCDSLGNNADVDDFIEDDNLKDKEPIDSPHIDEDALLKEVRGVVDEDKKFWMEMKKISKFIKVAGRKKRKKSLNGEGVEENEKTVCKIQKLAIHYSFEKGLDDNSDAWVTDEGNDSDHREDFDEMFKDEWRQKRLPANTRDKNYICDVCSKPYSKRYLLREHIIKEHRNHEIAKEYPFWCIHCKRVYQGKKQLDHHQTLHSGPCEVCGMMFGCSGLFWIHRKNHDAECKICRKSFASIGTLATHKKLKHNAKRYFCNICNKGFAYPSLLNIHKSNSHSLDSVKKGVKKIVNQDGTVEIDLNCDECNYVAKNVQSLKVHHGMAHKRKRRKVGDKYFACPICNAELSTKAILKRHMEKHVGPYPTHKCSTCNKMFSSQKKVKLHRAKVHGFVNEEGDDTQELRIVAGESDEYHCRSCNSSFISQSELQNHTFSVHGVPKKIESIIQDHIVYECAYCPTSFESSDDLQAHILSVHSVSQTMSRDIVQVASEPVHVTSTVEEFPVVEINLSSRVPENRVLGDSHVPVNTSAGNFDTRTTVSLPACAVPSDFSMVEIDGVRYHVIRNGK